MSSERNGRSRNGGRRNAPGDDGDPDDNGARNATYEERLDEERRVSEALRSAYDRLIEDGVPQRFSDLFERLRRRGAGKGQDE